MLTVAALRQGYVNTGHWSIRRVMSASLMLSLSALATLLPATVLPLRWPDRRNGVFWTVVGVGVGGSLIFSYALTGGIWHTGFAVTLWITIATTMALFALLALVLRDCWRLGALLVPYLFLLGGVATIWSSTSTGLLVAAAPDAWLVIHIVAAVLTYAFVTLAAVAGLAVLLRERAVRLKSPSKIVRILPSVADAERLQANLLQGGAVVMGLGLITGMAAQFFTTGSVIVPDHKVLFSIAAFVVIGVLVVAHYRSGLGGRRVARLALLAYLLLTLGFPGVKFVTDVLVAGGGSV